jgi:hypothetical protein
MRTASKVEKVQVKREKARIKEEKRRRKSNVQLVTPSFKPLDIPSNSYEDDNDLIGSPVEELEINGDMEFDSLEEEKTVDNTKSFLLKIGGYTVNKRLELMGTSVNDIKKFQLYRLLKTVVTAIVPIPISLVLHTYIPMFFSLVGGVSMWFMDYWRVARRYEFFQFHRQLDFNKFIRMLMPYLRGKNVVLYQALQKMKDRLPEGTTRTALITLITKLNTNPNSREPYEEFARNASGQDRSLLIMQTLYDFQRSSNDATTINELGKLVDHELSRDIDEIIERKDDRFEMESYLMLFSLIFVLLGYFLSSIIAMFMEFSSKLGH